MNGIEIQNETSLNIVHKILVLCVKRRYCCFFSGSSLGPSNVDSARQNLASSFVNGFVNAAFGQDKLLMEDGNKWIYKNKEHGKFDATGLVLNVINRKAYAFILG